MNDYFNVAILQLNAVNNSNESLIKGIEACKNAKTLGDAYRKPSIYKYLSEEHIIKPFVRKDSRRNLK